MQLLLPIVDDEITQTVRELASLCDVTLDIRSRVDEPELWNALNFRYGLLVQHGDPDTFIPLADTARYLIANSTQPVSEDTHQWLLWMSLHLHPAAHIAVQQTEFTAQLGDCLAKIDGSSGQLAACVRVAMRWCLLEWARAHLEVPNTHKALMARVRQCLGLPLPPLEVTSDETTLAAQWLEWCSACPQGWASAPTHTAPRLKDFAPVLPIAGKRNVLITSALPYVNNVPHLGNIIGCVLPADVFARYCRMQGRQTLYICGTDEYGTATETRAIQEGVSAREICDKYHRIHAEVYDWFSIAFDHFGRTTTDHQTQITQDFFVKQRANGHVFEQTVDQWYCESCARFLADRFVEGLCPHCGYVEARGDQCDKCGHLVNALELGEARCKLCASPPQRRSSKHQFLDLSRLEPRLRRWLASTSVNWSDTACTIANAWLRTGLKPRSITRDLQWGTPVPLPDYRDKVFYVWYDAPIGYISITSSYTSQWRQWWMQGGCISSQQQEDEEVSEARAHVQLYQFMAKDNVPFHAIMFPSSQLATGDPYTMVTHLMSSEYLNYEDGKFSKSRGVGVFGTDVARTGISSDVWRFYLLAVRPESHDSTFSWCDLMARHNNELLNNVGNFVFRALSFCARQFESVVPAADTHALEDVGAERALVCAVNRQLEVYWRSMELVHLRASLGAVLAVSRLGNQYFQGRQPWKIIASERSRAALVVAVAVNLVALIAQLLAPFMPQTCERLCAQLNVDHDALNYSSRHFVCLIRGGHRLGTPELLFNKIMPELIEQLQKQFAGN